jgi:Ca2+-binding EF-hand superfamily protein
MEGSKDNYFYVRLIDPAHEPDPRHTTASFALASLARSQDCDFVVADLKERWGLTLDHLKLLLKRFMEIDKDKDGVISKDEMLQLFHLQTSSDNYKNRLFSFFDDEDDGNMTFREFLQAVAVVSDAGATDDKATMAFVLADKGCKGGVSADDVRKIGEDAKKMGVLKEAVAVDEKALAKFDKGGKGMLDLDEWKAFCAEHDEVLQAPIGIAREQFGTSFDTVKRGKEEVEDNRV